MTYNVLYGGVGRESLIRDVVSAIAPHVAIFTEVTASKPFDAIAEMVGPHRARGGGPAAHEYPVIVSRWPIVHADRHGPPWAPQKWIEATMQPYGGPPVTVHGVHLTPQLLWPFEVWRGWEVRYLLKRLRAAAAAAHLVAGDFNALMSGDGHHLERSAAWVRAQWLLQGRLTPRWALRRLTRAGYVDCYRVCNPRTAGFTVPAWDPRARIDYLFASSGLAPALRHSGTPIPTSSASTRTAPRRRTVAEFLGRTAVTSLGGHASDHLPVWAEFDWPADDRTAATRIYS